MIKSNIKLFVLSFLLLISLRPLQSAEMVDPIKVDWSFKGLTGTFDRASLQRGFQVYKEVCASCHSMQYLSYRNCLLYTSPSPRDKHRSRMPSSA